MSKFDTDLNKAINNIEGAVEKAVRGAAIEMFSEIVRRTPVGNPTLWQGDAPAGYTGGRLRGNWQTSISRPNYAVTNNTDASGAAVTGQMISTVKRYNLSDDSIWFTNNLPYADRVENGWSTQRPQGMVRSTVKMFKPLIESIARIEKI